jgi:hypothetical protein
LNSVDVWTILAGDLPLSYHGPSRGVVYFVYLVAAEKKWLIANLRII